jgi:hypothetical protein
VSFDHHETVLHYGTYDVLDFSDGGTVEGALQASFVNVPAAYLAKFFRVDLAGTPGGQGEMH